MGGLDPLSAHSSPPNTSTSKWTVEESSSPVVSSPLFQPQTILEEEVHAQPRYVRFIDTLRLYAGWLLAWYVLIFAIGSYQLTRVLPYENDLFDQFFGSPILLSFAFGAFLFLLFSDLHHTEGRSFGYGTFLTLLGVALVWLFVVNT